MGVLFKKNGRPTKTEKVVLRNINNFLKTLESSEVDNYRFNNEVVTNGERLNQIWGDIINKNNSSEETQDIEVDEDTGEIFQKEDIYLKKENMEEAEVLSELNDNIEEIPSYFNPLKKPVMERSYQKREQIDVGEIKEPDFGNHKSASETLEEINEDRITQESKFYEDEEEEEEQGKKEWNNLRNEGMEELGDKDKLLASKQLVQTVLDGYEMLHEVGKIFVKYPEEKLQEKAINGDIDPTMEIPIDEHGTTTNPIDFFRNFNEQAEEAISYDPEFGEKVRPAMERVFAKKGWGMTDEQFLMVAFGKDIAWKGVQIMTLKKTANGIMSTFERLQKDKNDAIRQSKIRREKAQHNSEKVETLINEKKMTIEKESEILYEEESQDLSEEVFESDNESNEIHDSDIVTIH